MKQSISLEQLNELSDGQKEKLRNMWTPQLGDWIVDVEGMEGPIEDRKKDGGDPLYSYGGKWVTEKAKCLPLLSIGQMIALLDPVGRTIFTFCNMIAVEPSIYEVSVDGKKFYGANMCDALWEAVKQIL